MLPADPVSYIRSIVIKQKRASEHTWSGLLEGLEYERQAARDMDHIVRRLWECGFKQKDIAKAMGVTGSRVAQRRKRERKEKYRTIDVKDMRDLLKKKAYRSNYWVIGALGALSGHKHAPD